MFVVRIVPETGAVGSLAVTVGLFRCWQAWRWERRWALLSYRDAPFWRGGCLFFYGERAPQS